VAGTTAAATPTRPSCTAPTPNGPTKIDGKTVIRRLAPAELTACQPLFANAKKIRALLAELKDLILEIIDTALPPARHDRTGRPLSAHALAAPPPAF
jgi:hypothetical protein